jgi:glycosyltransferase involved in cell wall biosynthesis
MKSVLLFTGIYPPDIGGPATFVPQLEELFSSQGRSYQTITLADGISYSIEQDKKLILIARDLFLPNRILQVIFQGLWRARNCDVIFCSGLYEEAAIVSLLTGKPLISKVVGIPAWEAWRKIDSVGSDLSQGLENFTIESLPFILRLRNRIWERLLRKSQLIITPSRELERYLKSRGLTTPLFVIENGTIVDEFQELDFVYDVVTTVRLVPWKNLDILIAAAKEFDFSLAIIGDGPERKTLELMAEGDPKIHFLGVLDHASVSRVLMASKVFSLVSSYEGLSYSLIEALAHGKACVLSNATGNVDAMKDSLATLFVPVRDVKETGKAIRRFLDDESFRHLKGKAAREFALLQFAKGKQLKKVVELIDEL